MTKAQRARLQRHMNRCTDALQLRRVHIHHRMAEPVFGTKAKDRVLAAVCLNPKTGELDMYVSQEFCDLPPNQIDETIGHELLHCYEAPKWRLVDRWHKAGQITDAQYRAYEKREERQVLRLERAMAKLLPRWED